MATPHQIIDSSGNPEYYAVTLPFAWFLQCRLPTCLVDRLLQGQFLRDPAEGRLELDIQLFQTWARELEKAQRGLESGEQLNMLKLVRESKNNAAWQNLLAIAGGLKFQPHRITHLLDEKGRHELKLPEGFPFAVSLFYFRTGAITQRLTWHQRLELLVPLDGPLSERMGERVVELQRGDVLVVDHLKPHQAVDTPGLDTRAIVISFLPECVFTAGGPPTDYAFLIPFHRKLEGRPHILRAGSEQAGDTHEAMARLLSCYFDKGNPHREAGCKAWLLVLLNALIHEFRDSALQRFELLQRQKQSEQLKPLFDHVREHYANRVSVEAAAKLCGLSKAQFGRTFKQAAGMTLGSYLNQVRMTHAVELLEGTRDTIAEIAFRLGFSDQSHFDRRFRRTFGRTPSEHRARLVVRG